MSDSDVSDLSDVSESEGGEGDPKAAARVLRCTRAWVVVACAWVRRDHPPPHPARGQAWRGVCVYGSACLHEEGGVGLGGGGVGELDGLCPVARRVLVRPAAQLEAVAARVLVLEELLVAPPVLAHLLLLSLRWWHVGRREEVNERERECV